MMDAIETRLRATVPELRLVAGIMEFAALDKPPPREKMPAAYVLPMEDAGTPNTLASKYLRQPLTRRVSIMLLTTSARDPRGEAAATALEPVIAKVRAALVGWTPPLPTQPSSGAVLTQVGPMQFRRGVLNDMSDGVLAWGEEFTLSVSLSTAI